MTHEEQRIKIAEACGWTDVKRENRHEFGGLRGIDPEHGERVIVPDFAGDLSAIHRAIACQTTEVKHSYAVILAISLWPNFGWNDWRDTLAVSEATAAQKAEALLKALNLWTDEY